MPYCNTVNNLIETFDAYKSYFELENIGCFARAFEYPIVKINDLKESLDERIKEIDIPNKMVDFQKYMLSVDGCKSWMTNNENEISKLVSDYFIKLFSEYTNKTMTSYLQDKYNTDSVNELIQYIRNDIMEQLYSRNLPLLWLSTKYFAKDILSRGFMTVPTTSYEVYQAAENLALKNPEIDVRQEILIDSVI